MAMAGSIDAVLSLNATGFNEGITSATTALNKFANATKKLNSVNSSQAMRALNDAIIQLESSLQTLDGVNKKNLSTFTRLSTAVNNMAKGLKILQSDTLNVDQAVNTMNNIFKAFQGSLNGTEVRLKSVSATVKELSNTERSGVGATEQWSSAQAHSGRSAREVAMAIRQRLDAQRQLTSSTQQLTGSENQLQAESTQTAVAQEKVATSSNKASASMTKQATATRGLGRALSSLRMMGTMVGSMIAYNFIHNLAMATTETINAKSEMNGYFQMLGYTTRQTQDFNRALDQTVAKFPRLNKYALGETISSIGVEFELTTAEMKKAMPVVSMITSEYLRAGRNVNEASLAVKDILQGEFQRLSRETGVKGDQLKEAGWSGDKSDVMGLLEALEKVGKERNWDTFVQKANSLNDAVLILQNRFSEWSADMVERIQPAILSVFNNLMIIGTDFGKAFNKVLDWLGGNGLGQSIVKWGGLATAIGLVSGALVVYRTGANLTQIAQMGLTRSIGATILGLEAETVAQYGLRTSIIANLTHMEAEQVARQGRLNSIFASITGLKAEEVAEMGKARALASSILGLDMATVKTYGFTTALWSNITGVEAETIAVEGWNAQMFIAVAELGILAGAMAVFTGALVVQAFKINETTEQYKKFVNMLDKGDEIIAEAKDSVDDLTNKKQALSDKLNTLNKGTYEYNVTANKLKVTTDDLSTATQNYSDAVNSVAWVKHKQELYDEEKASAQASAQREINDALLDYGFNVQEASQLSNQYWNDAINGWNQHYETLQKVNLQYSKNATSVVNALNQLNNTKLDNKEVTVLLRRKITAGNEIANAKEELGNATSLTEYADKWLWLQVRQLQNALVDWDINNASGGIQQAIGGVVMGILHFFGDNFIGQFTQGLARDWGLEGSGTRIVDKIFKDGILSFLSDLFHWDDFVNDITGLFSGGSGNGMKMIDLSWLLQQLFNITDSVDFSWATDFINNNIIIPLSTAWNNFMADPLSAIGGFLSSTGVGGLLSALLGNDGGVSVWSWVQTNVITPLSNGITNGIASIPIVGTIAQMLGLVPQQDQNAYTQGYNLIDQFKQGVEKKIGEIPIVGDIARMLGLIPQQNSNANSKGHGIGSNIDQGTRGGMQNMGQFILSEFNDALAGIGQLGQQAYNTARDWAGQLWDGVNSILQRHSPGFFHDQFMLEFGTDIPNAITSSGDTAYSVAQYYGQRIKDGVSSVNTDVSLDGMVGEYQDDAQIVASSSQLMGSTTTTAFNQMQTSVNATTTQMTGNVTSSYSTMQQRQATLLNNMKASNTTAYNEMYTKSNQSLLRMRDSTANVTHQMTNAWSHMKDQIVASANRLKSESTSHFNQLSSTIGSFYRKIQNPSNWGAGSPNIRSSAPRPSKGRRAVRTIRGARHGAGVNPYQSSESLTLRELLRMTGVSDTTKMDLNTFLASIWGEHGFGWNDWSGRHYNYIKEKSDAWSMKPPMIMGYIPAGDGFKVGEFEGGQPHITWSTFMSTAEALFSTIPYKFYWDSNWKGDWVSALKAGATNCSDGSEALIALAETMGFSGVKVHTTTKSGLGHFYALINGHKMDTTNYQHNRSWTPLGAGIPTRAYGRSTSGAGQVQGKTVNITVDMSNSTVYGVDDLDSRIKDGVQKGLQEEFNDPYTVAI